MPPSMLVQCYTLKHRMVLQSLDVFQQVRTSVGLGRYVK